MDTVRLAPHVRGTNSGLGHMALGAARWHARHSESGGNVRQGPHGRTPGFHAPLRGHCVLQGPICGPALRVRSTLDREDVLLVPYRVCTLRHQARSSRPVLRKHCGRPVR